MAALRFSLMTLVALLCVMMAASSARAEPNHITVSLIAERSSPMPGTTVMLAVAMQPEPGWHDYWSNPGEAGLPPRLAWELPKGAMTDAVRFPVPRPLSILGLTNYVYEGPHALLVPLRLPTGLAPGSVQRVGLSLDYLACTDKICVPQHAHATTDLTISSQSSPPVDARFDEWRRALPTPLGGTASFERRGTMLRLAIPFPAGMSVGHPQFLPAAPGLIVDAASQRFGQVADVLVAEISAPASAAAPVAGLLVFGEGRGVAITATPGAVPPLPLSNTGNFRSILFALGGALLGGLILNVMPCVFPILSLKALSLAKAGGDEGAARRDALGYTLGAVLVCVGLGGAILTLRAGGASVGWAFQLQDPRVIVGLLVLVAALAFNLAGLFELPTLGGGLTTGNSVATGALAAFVATPCTGPFMGAALGAALVLPTAAALAVFAGLGLGLALPFLALGFVPALRRMLPRPGLWLVTLRRALSVPMFLTALGLAWLLGRQAGVDALTVGLLAVLAAALALWWAGLRQAGGRAGLTAGLLTTICAAGLAVTFLPRSAPVAAAALAPDTETFSEPRLAALRAARRPVFVYFTADWCLTCKVNERVAIDRPEVAAAFRAARVATLVGDWTRSDPAIGRFLEAQGRSGVPLYLYYSPGGDAQVLPQVLTPGMLTTLAL